MNNYYSALLLLNDDEIDEVNEIDVIEDNSDESQSILCSNSTQDDNLKLDTGNVSSDEELEHDVDCDLYGNCEEYCLVNECTTKDGRSKLDQDSTPGGGIVCDYCSPNREFIWCLHDDCLETTDTYFLNDDELKHHMETTH